MSGRVKVRFKFNQAMKFIIVGIGGVAADYLVYQGLMALGFNMSAAKGLSYVSVASLAFILNKLWTFERDRFITSELIRYGAVYAFSAGVNVAINKAFMMIWGVRILAFLIATGSSAIVNFLGLKFFVFDPK